MERRRIIGGDAATTQSIVGSPSSSWEITGSTTTTTADHVSLSIDQQVPLATVDHAMHDIDLNHRRHPTASTPPPASPQRHRHHQQQQYASNSSGMVYQKAPMTEETLRRFSASHRHHKQPPYQPASSSSSPRYFDRRGSWCGAQRDQFRFLVVVHRAGQPSLVHRRQQPTTTRLEDYHTVFRTPLHVPDSEYEAYLLGRRKRAAASIVTQQCCAATCAGFSAVAVLFLLFIGILLDTQPLYIPGTLPELVVQSTVQYKSNKNSNGGSDVTYYTKPVIQYLVPGPADERLPIAKTAYQAAWAYLGTLLVSLYVLDPRRFRWVTRSVRRLWSMTGLMAGSSKKRRRMEHYDHVPDHHPYNDDDVDDYESGLLPYHKNQRGSTNSDFLRAASLHQPGIWNRATGNVKRWLAVRGWYRVRRKHKSRKKG